VLVKELDAREADERRRTGVTSLDDLKGLVSGTFVEE
jgi:hypothetical protein